MATRIQKKVRGNQTRRKLKIARVFSNNSKSGLLVMSAAANKHHENHDWKTSNTTRLFRMLKKKT